MTTAPAPSVRLRTIAAATTALVLLAVVGCGRLPSRPTAAEDRYAVLLDQLPVVPRPRRDPGYRRAMCGPAWADTDHNGCLQRQDAVFRDLDRASRSTSDGVEAARTRCTPAPGPTPTPAIGAPSRT